MTENFYPLERETDDIDYTADNHLLSRFITLRILRC